MKTASLALAAVILSVTSAAAQPSTLTGDVERGRKIFMDVGCHQCHGTVGQGGNAGLRLAPNPRSADFIATYIRKPPLVMPPYTEAALGNQAVADIHAYLASIKPPPPISEIPLLKQLAP